MSVKDKCISVKTNWQTMHTAVFKQFRVVVHGDPTGVEYRIVKNAVTMQITEPVVGNIKVYKEWTVPWGSVEVRRLIPKEWEDRVEPLVIDYAVYSGDNFD